MGLIVINKISNKVIKCYLITFTVQNFILWDFISIKKVADKKATAGAKNTTQASSSKFIAKASTKSSGGI